MIRRHPWRTLAIAGAGFVVLTGATWVTGVNLWWTWQGKQSWGRP